MSNASLNKRCSTIAQKSDYSTFKVEIYLSSFVVQQTCFFTLIIRPSSDNTVEKSKILLTDQEPYLESSQEGFKAQEKISTLDSALFELERSRKKIWALENAFQNILASSDSTSIRTALELRGLDPALDEVETELTASQQKDLVSETIVNIMCFALNLWEISTGKTKIELAEESKIWRVYIDGGTWKTRTLDKYLKLRSLPQRPRWREVVRTANFVLRNCQLNDDQQSELQNLVNQLQNQLRRRV